MLKEPQARLYKSEGRKCGLEARRQSGEIFLIFPDTNTLGTLGGKVVMSIKGDMQRNF